jgi:hypothetical protein
MPGSGHPRIATGRNTPTLDIPPVISGLGLVAWSCNPPTHRSRYVDSCRRLRMQYSLVVINVRTGQYCISAISHPHK